MTRKLGSFWREFLKIWIKKHKKALTACALLAVLLVAALFLLRWSRINFLKTMYPRTYSEIVVKEAKRNGLDPNFVYAVIRAESNFDSEAKSKAGALGLMQLTPATFEWLQKREEASPVLPEDDLYKPEINIRYGCRFLSLLLQTYPVRRTALCAYNAGMGTVNQWLKRGEISKDGKSLDAIPYPETRNYADTVELYYQRYRDLYGSGYDSE